MPQVFTTGSRRRTFHRTKDCYELAEATGEILNRPLEEIDARHRPCRVCYPDAPHVRVLHRYCTICNTGGKPQPCEHNGGVRVVVRHNPFTTSQGRRSLSYIRTFWVWPEFAHRYQ